ncbi:LpqB family beta-propeller domain-containing protein [Arthrobacter sp. E3]|uniref:LpqB family beta-propeller domain-containing protein n=1 Tax=Arthrobacter sp. E3 TaxID=517402 RepID=UPI001A94DA14
MDKPRPRRPQAKTRRHGTFAAWVMAVVVLLVVAGCAAIPTSGPVGKSDPMGPRDNSVNINFQQFSPVDGASAESIVSGFVDSGTGINDDFQVARQYLTPGLAQSWAPDQRTLVYKDAFAVTPAKGKDTFEVKFDVVSTVDASGVLTPAKSGASETFTMKVVQVDGQWRISEAPDGVMLSEATFQTLFSSFSLYFYDPTFTYGVPDVRWLTGRSSRTSTAIVKAMLGGPAPYLKGAVVSAFPNGITLERDSVPVNNGLAKVGLTAQPLLETSVKQRQQMHAQLLVTLQKALNTVTGVQFLADDREVDMGGAADSVKPMIIDNVVPPTQVGLAKNELVTFDGTKIAAIPKMASVANLQPAVPAISYSGKNFAFRAGEGNQIYSVVPGGRPELAISGVALTPPSFAPDGWLWSAAGDGSGMVIAINPNDGGKLGAPVVLTIPWLVGREVTTLRISRDGTRALVLSHTNGSNLVSLTGVFKSAGIPKELTPPLSLTHTGTPTLGVWEGETGVAVMAPADTAPVSIQILNLAQAPVKMDELPGLQWLSAGSGARNINAQTSSDFYTNAGNNWELVAKELKQASFAG